MEAVVSVLGSIIVGATRLIFAPVFPKVRKFLKFQSNIVELEKEMQSVIDLKNNIKEKIADAEKYENIAKIHVSNWLREAEEIEVGVSSLKAEYTANSENLHGWCCLDCRMRYRLSKQVEKKLEEVKQIKNRGSFPEGLVEVNYSVKVVEHIQGPSIEGQKTASKNLDKVLDLLKDDGVRIIGIWGMGGAGKTTLLKNLNNKLETDTSLLPQPFTIVVWVTVSKDFDLERTQIQIAQRLRLEARTGESKETMAARLCERLNKEKKFLLILDDVWDRIDLDEVGIPQLEIHQGHKLIRSY